MPKKFHNIRQNFSAGVLSPRLSARTDSEAFNNALREGTNWIISSQGGAVMREGMKFIGYSASNDPFRLFQFLRGGEQSDLLIEVTAGTIRFWYDDGEPQLYADRVTILTDENDGEELTDENDGEFITVGVITAPNPYTLEDLDTLYFVNQDKYGIICSANHPPMYITFRKDGTILVDLFPREKIPFFDYNDVNAPRTSSELASFRLNFPASWLESNFMYYVTYNNVYPGIYGGWFQDAEVNRTTIENLLQRSIANQGLSTLVSVSIVDGNLGSYSVTFTGPDSGGRLDLYMGVTAPGAALSASGYSPIQMPPLNQAESSDVGPELAWSYPNWVFHATQGIYYKCVRTHRAAAENEPGVGADWAIYWELLGIEKPSGFDYQFPSGNDWSLLDGSGDVNIYGPMDRGFPTVASFHQQRLVLMANKDNPTALYGSGIGEYQNFLVGVNDDEAWLFVLDSTDSPQIKWALSDRELILGTSSGEWVISAEITITPTDIQAIRQNASRSHLTRPAQIDTEVFYIEQGNRKIRSTRYVRQRGSFVSQNISLAAEHLISTYGVTRLAIQHVPEVMMTAVTGDGQFITMTYENIGTETVVQAFTPHTTDAEVYDVASYFSIFQNRDSTYFAVKRNNNWVIERMRYPCSKVCTPLAQNGVVMMDSWVTGNITSINDQSVIDGLFHIDGKKVHVLVNDAWVEGDWTVNNGQVAIPSEYTGTFAAGLPYCTDEDGEQYYGKLVTFEMADNIRGTGMGAARRWANLTTRLLNSALPKIYTKRDRDRTPATVMNTPETIRDGLQDITQTGLGYGDGSIEVVQDRPYPTHVIAFFGEYQVEDR